MFTSVCIYNSRFQLNNEKSCNFFGFKGFKKIDT